MNLLVKTDNLKIILSKDANFCGLLLFHYMIIVALAAFQHPACGFQVRKDKCFVLGCVSPTGVCGVATWASNAEAKCSVILWLYFCPSVLQVFKYTVGFGVKWSR